MVSDQDPDRTGEMVRLAADAAGVALGRFTTSLVSRGSINQTRMVRGDDGARYVLQQYGWPFAGPDDLDRPGKEAWPSDLVRGHGVPASRELSWVRAGDAVVVLREYLPGQPLGDVPVTCAPAWRSAGARWPGFIRYGSAQPTLPG